MAHDHDTADPGRTSDEPVEVLSALRDPFARVPEGLIDDLTVSPLGVRLWAVLDRYARDRGRAWPRRRTLAERVGVSLNTLDRALAELERAGWLHREARHDQGGSRVANAYVLTAPSPLPTYGEGGRHARGGPLPTDGEAPSPHTGRRQKETQGEGNAGEGGTPRAGARTREAAGRRRLRQAPPELTPVPAGFDDAVRDVAAAIGNTDGRTVDDAERRGIAERMLAVWPDGWGAADWREAVVGFLAGDRWWSGSAIAAMTGQGGLSLGAYRHAGRKVLAGEAGVGREQPGTRMARDLEAWADTLEAEEARKRGEGAA